MSQNVNFLRRHAHPGGAGQRRWAARLGLVLLAGLLACGDGHGPAAPEDADLPGPGRSLAGAIEAEAGVVADSDLNDLDQPDRRVNDDAAQAQALQAPVRVVGTVNRPLAGPAGANRAAGDETDVYAVDLHRGDRVVLEAGRATDEADLDLYVQSADGLQVGASDGTGSRHECLAIDRPGRYLVTVAAFRGASTYQLHLIRPDTAGAADCATHVQPARLEPDALIVQDLQDPQAGGPDGRPGRQALALARVRAAAVDPALASSPGRPRLLRLPQAAPQRRVALDRLAGTHAAADDAPDTPRTPGADDPRTRTLDTLRLAKALQASGAYAWAQPDWLLTAQAAAPPVLSGLFPPDDPGQVRQRWHHDLIELPAALARLAARPVASGERPVIAVIDTGIRLDHPDLAPQLASSGLTFASRPEAADADAQDGDDRLDLDDPLASHGTHVAGLAAAATWNSRDIAGVAPMARLMPLNVFGRQATARTHDIVQAMRYAAGLENSSGRLPARRADVINLSLGSPGRCSPAFQDTVNRVRAAGTLIVAATGSLARNDRDEPAEVQQPAGCAGVIAVSAIDAQGRPAAYTHVGPEVALAAPGGDPDRPDEGLLSTVVARGPDGRPVPTTRSRQGTSMAAPQVSGVLALMRHADPALGPADVDALLAAGRLTEDIGPAGHDPATGWGRLSARKAVEAALEHAARGAGPIDGGSPALAVHARPARIDLGAHLGSAEVELRPAGAASLDRLGDRVTGVQVGSAALVLRPVEVDAAGFGRYALEADRRRLDAEGVRATAIAFLIGEAGLRVEVPVTLTPPGGLPGSILAGGAVRVELIDPDRGRVVHVVRAEARDGRLVWRWPAYRRARLAVRAGCDLDHDGRLCGPGEPCARWPEPASGAASGLPGVTLDGPHLAVDLKLRVAPPGPD